MMGQAVGQQDRLLYEFNLDARVPPNHLLRRIDAVLERVVSEQKSSPKQWPNAACSLRCDYKRDAKVNCD